MFSPYEPCDIHVMLTVDTNENESQHKDRIESWTGYKL